MGVTLRHFLCLMVIAFAITYICIPLVKKLATRLGAIDYPSARRVNHVPIPRMGGVAVAVGIFATLFLEVVGETCFDWAGFFASSGGLHVNYAGVIAGLLLTTLVGAVDDVVSLRPKIKLLGQVVAASIIVCSGLLLSSVANPFAPGFIHFGWFAYPLTVLYLVAFMNVINLVDGLDGLAGGIVSIAATTMFIIALMGSRVETAMFSIVLLGATLAFLRFNYSPASIFMGDSGSLLMGAMLGVISLLGVMRSPAVIVMAAPLVIAAIPIADTLFAIIRRVRNHQPIQQADTNHLHHLLLKEGFSTKKAVAIVHLWTAVLALGAFFMSNMHGVVVFMTFVVLVVVSFMVLWKLKIFKPVLSHHYGSREQRKSDAAKKTAQNSNSKND